jgi:hypothetical protein
MGVFGVYVEFRLANEGKHPAGEALSQIMMHFPERALIAGVGLSLLGPIELFRALYIFHSTKG